MKTGLRRTALAITLFLLLLLVGYTLMPQAETFRQNGAVPRGDVIEGTETGDIVTLETDPVLDERGRAHILEGHLAGAGVPCKSEFPADWDAGAIEANVERLAANDNAQWRREDNGYYVTEGDSEDGLKVRVVIDGQRQHIVTAYPLNVDRNACE